MVDQQLINVIKKSLNRIDNGDVQFGLLGLSEKEITPEPRFYKLENNKLRCYQQNAFGVYVLKSAYRGILMGINYLVAGDNNLSHKLLGPAVSNYYTCAYHIFGAYLALKGRVIIDSILLLKGKEFSREQGFAIVTFSKGKWNINEKKSSHIGRWNELKQLRLDEYPVSFTYLFKYWFKFRTKEDISVNELLLKILGGEQLGTPLHINDIQDEFLRRISGSRHAAIYESFGSDSEVMMNLVNGDASSDTGIDWQARAFKEFCYRFLNENVELLIDIFNHINLSKETGKVLRAAIFQPWFDEPQIQQIDDKYLKQRIETLKSFIIDEQS